MSLPPRHRSSLLGLALLAALLLNGCGVSRGVAAYYGIWSTRVAPAALSSSLRPHDELFTPPGPGPFATVVMAPGCYGTRPFHRRWARFFVEQGFAAVIMDSFRARGLDGVSDYESVCEGDRIWGFERAGDLLVTLEDLRARPEVDAERLALVGWSHGAWSVMDAMALDGSGQGPPLLSDPPAAGLEGVQAVALLYPYCGFGSYSRRVGWEGEVPALLFLGQRDAMVSAVACEQVGRELRAAGEPLEMVVFDADHWFDSPGGQELVPHAYDPEATAEARRRIAELFRARLR